jgi:hypothetical protein
MRRKIPNETWDQIKTAYAAGVGLREIARKMNLPEGTVLARATRDGWTRQIQVLRERQSDAVAVTPVQSVPQSLFAILAERRDRTKLGLSKYIAEASEQAAEHKDKLSIASKVRDVSQVHSTLWPEQQNPNAIVNIALLTSQVSPIKLVPPKELTDEGDS